MPGGTTPKVSKACWPPLEEFVALAVALEFHFEIEREGLGVPEEIDLHGVIDDEVDGDEWLDDPGIFAESLDCTPHGGEIDEERDAGEVLKDDAGYDEGNLFLGGRSGFPIGKGADVLGVDLLAVTIPENTFEDDANADGEF